MPTFEQQIKDNIQKYGVHIIHVMEEDDLPNFSYTIGLFENFQLPEMIIVGLDQELNQVILNNIAYDYKEGIRFESGKLFDNILDDYKCLVLDLDKSNYEEYVGIAMDYYKGTDFPVMQIIWPTKSNIYPFDKEAPQEFKDWQPVLGNYSAK